MTKKRKLKTKNVKRKIALVLSIIAITFLMLNLIYYFFAKENLMEKTRIELQKLPKEFLEGKDINDMIKMASNVFTVLAIVWLILAFLIIWTTVLLEKEKGKWYVLVIIGIFALLTLRIEAGILCIISGILYKK